MSDRMSQEEFDNRMNAGEDPYSIIADDLARQGYVFKSGRWVSPREEQARTDAVISVIRRLGFVGNSHYCADCMNTFHGDRGQHKPDCGLIAGLNADDDWWDWPE